MRGLLVIGVVVIALLVGPGTVLAQEPSGQASCIGIEAADISPPGSSGEFPGGMTELTAIVRDIADGIGIPPGAIISFVAKIHAGSHEACDEATE